MSTGNPLRDNFRKPSPSRFIVLNSEKQPMGRMTLSAPFGPVLPQFAACFTLEEAAEVARQIGGKAVPMPVFDDEKQTWVIPSLETSISQ